MICKTVAYLRVSTNDQDVEKNKADILTFANERRFGNVEWVEEKVSGKLSWKCRAIKSVIDDLGNGDRLLVPELSRLGRSMLEIMEILSVAKEKGINIYAVKGGWELNGTLQSKVMAMAFAIAAEIEHDLISQRTREALKARKAQGVQLGIDVQMVSGLRFTAPPHIRVNLKGSIAGFLSHTPSASWRCPAYTCLI